MFLELLKQKMNELKPFDSSASIESTPSVMHMFLIENDNKDEKNLIEPNRKSDLENVENKSPI